MQSVRNMCGIVRIRYRARLDERCLRRDPSRPEHGCLTVVERQQRTMVATIDCRDPRIDRTPLASIRCLPGLLKDPKTSNGGSHSVFTWIT